ncbi:MAG: septal ring lytic transglycosylase RlpA family protein [Thermodesulfobacteriota bacterium]
MLGKTYYPISDADGFQQTGKASWYGDKFHGKKTANGEIYDMHAETAAHKTLPLGTFVKVRNLENNRETVVRINDRGPFVSGRIIDLSYKAARDIDMVGNGTARVKIVAMAPSGEGGGEVSDPPDFDSGDFTVQIGAFADHARAKKLRQSLARQHDDVTVTPVEKQGRTLYRVRIGRFQSLEEAEKYETRIKQSGHAQAFAVARGK